MKNIGTKKFYKNLKNKNDSCVYNINPNDKNRLIRSWEIHKITNKSIYENIFNPQTNFGKKTMKLWANTYSYDKIFLQDQKKLISKEKSEIL